MPECDCGPWIKLSHCGVGKFDPRTNTLVEVACPARSCMKWVPLVHGRIDKHDGWVPGGCPWIGVRVVDDRADVPARQRGIIDNETVRRDGTR